MITKEADSIIGYVEVKTDKNEAIKADSVNTNDINKIQAKLVINTTNIMDSHSDVHLKGIWNKTVKEQKPALLQEHQMFNSIISDKVTAK
jgi:hypothetical protein